MTVCVPVFGGAAVVARCLASVLAQGVDGVEVLVVDNASADGSAEAAERALRGVPGATVVRNARNIGRVANWNRCLELARGEWVKFVMVNDVLLPGALRMLVDAADARTVMVCSRPRFERGVPSPLPPAPRAPRRRTRTARETLEWLAADGNQTGGLGGMLVRRAAVVAEGLRFSDELPYLGDFAFAIALANHGETVCVDAESYVFDEGVTSRYHLAGLDARRVLGEYRACALRLEALIRARGGNTGEAWRGLWRQFLWFYYQRAPLSARESWALFAGSPRYQALAAANCAYAALDRRAPFLVPTARRVRASARRAFARGAGAPAARA